MRAALLPLLLVCVSCSSSSTPADTGVADRALGDRLADHAKADGARADLLQPDIRPRPPAHWDKAADLAQARRFHTATLLQDGTVLVAGGLFSEAGYEVTASAERYDPKTGGWSSTGALSDRRYQHDAVRLQDGRVLVVGGCRDYYTSCVEISEAVELYDPSSSTWKTTSSPLQPRFAAAVALLQDGRVLIAGGYSGANHKSLELYDPKTGSWSAPIVTLPGSRANATATVLASGKVLIAGGYDGDAKQVLDELLIYDPTNGSITKLTAGLKEARSLHTATLLADGRVLLVGGACDTSSAPSCTIKNAEIYDPKSDLVSVVGSPATDVFAHTATLLQDGRVLVVGGVRTSSQVRLFDPIAASWSTTPSPLEPRAEHAAALLGDGRVLVSGGYNLVTVGSRNTAEIYTP